MAGVAMTNINELAQRMKAAAEKATEAHERLSAMPSDGLFDASLAENAQLESDITALVSHSDASTPANVLALVEALEAKQPHHNGMMQLSNELVMAKQRIAELESRTVTVKLPADAEHDVMAPVAAYFSEKFGWDGGAIRWDGRKEYDVLSDRVKYALKMVCRRAGIQVIEGEGQ